VLYMSFDGSSACTFFVPPLFLILASTRHTLASLDHCLCAQGQRLLEDPSIVVLCRSHQCELVACLVDHKRVDVRSKTKDPRGLAADKPTRQKRSMPACSRGESRPEHASTRPSAADAACSRPAAAAGCFLCLTPSLTVIDQTDVPMFSSSCTSSSSREAAKKSEKSASPTLVRHRHRNRGRTIFIASPLARRLACRLVYSNDEQHQERRAEWRKRREWRWRQEHGRRRWRRTSHRRIDKGA
jgi:hypothetical protein